MTPGGGSQPQRCAAPRCSLTRVGHFRRREGGAGRAPSTARHGLSGRLHRRATRGGLQPRPSSSSRPAPAPGTRTSTPRWTWVSPPNCRSRGGSSGALDRLVDVALHQASRLDHPGFLAHMDPPTPWVTWAATAWSAAARLDADMATAGQLADLVSKHPVLELWGRSVTGVVNWRPRHHDPVTVRDRVDGAWVSTADIDGQTWFRSVAINPLADPRRVRDAITAGPLTPTGPSAGTKGATRCHGAAVGQARHGPHWRSPHPPGRAGQPRSARRGGSLRVGLPRGSLQVHLVDQRVTRAGRQRPSRRTGAAGPAYGPPRAAATRRCADQPGRL